MESTNASNHSIASDPQEICDMSASVFESVYALAFTKIDNFEFSKNLNCPIQFSVEDIPRALLEVSLIVGYFLKFGNYSDLEVSPLIWTSIGSKLERLIQYLIHVVKHLIRILSVLLLT